MMRWLIRVVATAVGLSALVGTGWVLKRFSKDPAREMFREGVAAHHALQVELGLDSNLRVEPVAPGDEQVVVTVRFPAGPKEPAARRELLGNTNKVVRRHVHRIRELKVLFDDETPAVRAPSPDGGADISPLSPVVPPADYAPPVATTSPPAAAPDAGTPRKVSKVPNAKMGVVTLVTFPDADVFEGKNRVGRTPLFNSELKAGTHLLTLVGPDGARHKLSLPVKVGKNAPLKVNLADLPAR